MKRDVRSSGRAAEAAGLHYSILLTGVGTVFLGPLLPILMATLHLTDRGAGALLAAQFIGAFLGGWTTTAPLERSIARAYLAAIAGFAALGWSCNHALELHWVLAALLVLGFGVGQLLTAVNLLASRKWTVRRGAALTMLNFTWSLGALAAPVTVLRLSRAYRPGTLMLGMCVLLLFGFAVAWLTGMFRDQAASEAADVPQQQARGLATSRFLFFALLLVVYGGVETSMSGWLTTYGNRYGSGLSTNAALSATLFWACLTSTRALATAALLRMRESLLLRGGLLLAVVALAGLLGSHTIGAIEVWAGVLGAALAPWFPLVLSQMVGESVTAAQAGKIIAVSGLGAAALPWLVGQTSASTGSLRVGLAWPVLGVAVLLLCSFHKSPKPATSESV